ncbi:MAG: threonine--tRNA ligase [Elusimicrobia bacterium]|nr:threonine--tRNA ligase [Elusimicrobiota bacterium]
MATEKVEIPKDIAREEMLHRMRHSCAHLMAQAVQALFPETHLTIGPPIEDGFYYDFDSPHHFTPEDLEKIETKMLEIAKGNHSFTCTWHSKEEAKMFFAARGEKYKLEILDGITDEKVSYYHHDTFIDLCEGPHVDSTQKLQYFKLLKIAGSYWRGDEKRERLQRIYGTVWSSQKELDDYLQRLEEAKKRDHRELGKRLNLFSIQPEMAGPGIIYWHPKGAQIRETIENFLRETLKKEGYLFVYTPHIARLDLWKTSGHWDYYQENMFPPIEIENQPFILKPMNCPGHILIYKDQLHSYRDLPIRLAEFGTVYRYERSGVMHGLLRVRGFTQDDAHIFCRMDQLQEECANVLKLTLHILQTFGFRDYDIKLSTRPEKFSGALENWELAESALKKALTSLNLPYEIDPGEGVFYGPKIDLKIRDCLNREWQCSTVQVDFNLPQKFDVTYRNSEGKESHCVMVHRALLGSLERFIGILIEHHAGLFPLWLSPIQATILTITEGQNEYAQEIRKSLLKENLRVAWDERTEKIGLKIREASINKIPYLLIVGEKEKKEGTITVRKQDGSNLGAMTCDSLSALLRKEIESRGQNPI